MKYTTQRLEISRGIVKQQEERVTLQRRKIFRVLAERHPADQLQAQLLIMEQSLLSMTRFLRILERDLESELALHKVQTRSRIRPRQKSDRRPTQPIDKLADQFAAQATPSVPAQEEGPSHLESLAKTMRPAHR